MKEDREKELELQKEIEESRVLRQRDENPLKPVHSNMVENVKEEIIQAYEAALADNNRDVIKRMEWELSTVGVHKKELREYVERRKAARGGAGAGEAV
ncbi:MAG: hypothetical protein IKI75_04120 [Lachnospiraceae bacterium]|nr:hypothetical protein [Lachnospiraceae bacterium]